MPTSGKSTTVAIQPHSMAIIRCHFHAEIRTFHKISPLHDPRHRVTRLRPTDRHDQCTMPTFTSALNIDSNMNRIIIYLTFLTIISLRSHCQKHSFDTTSITNDSFTFQIVMATPTAQMEKEHKGKFGDFVEIPMNANTRDSLEKLDSAFWIAHLNDEKTDWATNLVLYYLYQKDATVLSVFRTREKWLPLKADDIQYWTQYFRKSAK